MIIPQLPDNPEIKEEFIEDSMENESDDVLDKILRTNSGFTQQSQKALESATFGSCENVTQRQRKSAMHRSESDRLRQNNIQHKELICDLKQEAQEFIH
jgi:hypothetical protein